MSTKNKNNRPKRNKNKTKRNKIKNKRILSRRIKKKTKKRTKRRTKRYRNVNLIKQVGGRDQSIYSTSEAGDWYLYTGARMPGGFGTAEHDYLYDKNKWKLQTPPVEKRRGDGFIFINDILFVDDGNGAGLSVEDPPARVDKLKDILKWWPVENRDQPYGTTDEALRDPNILERLVFEIRDHTGTLELPIIQAEEVKFEKQINCGTYACAFEATVTSAHFSGDLVIKQQCNRRGSVLSFDKRKSNEIMIMAKIRQRGGYPHILELKGLVENMPRLIQGDGDLVCETIAIPPCIRNLQFYLGQSPPGGRSKREIFKLIEDVLNAIIYLHGIGILHGDIHADNIMECDDKSFGGSIFKLIDFGKSSFVVREGQKYLDFKEFNDHVLMISGISGRRCHMKDIHDFVIGNRTYTNNSYLMRGLEIS